MYPDNRFTCVIFMTEYKQKKKEQQLVESIHAADVACYNSSSSSVLTFGSADRAADRVLGAEVDMTEPRAALRLWVLEYLSPSAP